MPSSNGCRARTRRAGHVYFYAVVDDHSRLVHGELRGNEGPDTVTVFTR